MLMLRGRDFIQFQEKKKKKKNILKKGRTYRCKQPLKQ